MLLYTDADFELATYVRTHFDDLNVLSGPATRVFVVERRALWKDAQKYWRRHLEPELYRAMSSMRWLQWTPYEPQGAYEIASLLDLGPELLPCLVFFHSLEGPIHEGEKIIFPIEHTSTAYLRTHFGGIRQALRPVSESPATPRARGKSGRSWSLNPTSGYAPALTAVRNLVSSGRAADATASAAVRNAEQAIKGALRPLVLQRHSVTGRVRRRWPFRAGRDN